MGEICGQDNLDLRAGILVVGVGRGALGQEVDLHEGLRVADLLAVLVTDLQLGAEIADSASRSHHALGGEANLVHTATRVTNMTLDEGESLGEAEAEMTIFTAVFTRSNIGDVIVNTHVLLVVVPVQD